jgi:hypothetical protein
MMADSKDKKKKAIYEEVSTLYKRVSESVKKARDSVKDHGKTNEAISSLMQYDLFNFRNWDTTKLPHTLSEDLGVSSYESEVPHPLSEQHDKSQYVQITDDIVDSFMKKRSTPSPYKDDVVNGIMNHYLHLVRANEGVFDDNISRTERLYNYISANAQSRIDGKVGGSESVKEKLNEIKIGIDNRLAAKKRDVDKLNSDIEIYENIITPGPGKAPVAKDPNPVSDLLSVVGESFKRSFRILCSPFVYLGKKLVAGFGGVFKKTEERFQTFSTFVSELSALPLFWVTVLIATPVNGWTFVQTFRSMFSDTSTILLITLVYITTIVIMPFFTSKQLYEYNEERERSVVRKASIACQAAWLSLISLSYPLITLWNRHIFGGNEATVVLNNFVPSEDPFYGVLEFPQNYDVTTVVGQEQVIAAILIGVIPLLTVVIIGFCNYFRLLDVAKKVSAKSASVKLKTKPKVKP